MFFGRRITPPFLFPVRPWKKGTGNKLIKLQTLREWERERDRDRNKKQVLNQGFYEVVVREKG